MKVNLIESKVYGIGVDEVSISQLASVLHCEPASFPFTYRGLPIGANVKLARNWSHIMEKFKAKLSLWKARKLLFGGSLTLVKAVLGSLHLFCFSLF